jgi:tetratricopeptide (TPR) repeat protein
MAEAGPGASGGYVAFISYSHKDAKVGRWLHRKLEGYRLPKRLAGTQGEDGEVPARLTPIFRDRDELPAAGNLSERVRAALAVSRNLIVVCSPNSAGSPWVAKEIATFRELHPDRPIFTAIVEGEPDQCFSPELLKRGVEPLAADLRKGGDGRRLGLLKLVAGLAGVGLDALVQRDAARRVRRVTYVTAAAITGMLVMALSLVVAVNARAEADRQRAEAEGLVQFMLTDLRENLRGAVRISIMKKVNERALAYYGRRRDLAGLPDTSLALRARVLQAIGDDYIDVDDSAKALAAYREAEKTTAQLVTRAPGNPQWLFDHAKTLGGIGRAYEIRSDLPVADRYFAAFASSAQHLLRFAPNDPDYLMKAASAFIDLGNLRLKQTGDFAGAQRSYEKAISYLQRAAARRPEDHHVLLLEAKAYGWLADTYFYRTDWSSSLLARQKQRELGQVLRRGLNRRNRNARRPEEINGDILFSLAGAQRGIGCSLLELERRREGKNSLEAAYAEAEQLRKIDPSKADWKVLLKKLETDLAQFERTSDNNVRCVISKPTPKPSYQATLH